MEAQRKFSERIARYVNDKRIQNTLVSGIAGYLVMVLVFGIIFYLFNSLSANTNNAGKQLSFFDYLYFSLVTFSTIGYGEIIPTGLSGKVIIAIESCIGLAYTPFFGGYLAYLFIQRPKDFFLTENIFIRHHNSKIYLSARVGNKGKPIVDCDATIDMFQIENNVKRTLFKHAFSRPLVEISWYINLRLDDPDNPLPLHHLNTVLSDPEHCLIGSPFRGRMPLPATWCIYSSTTRHRISGGVAVSWMYTAGRVLNASLLTGIILTEPPKSVKNRIRKLTNY